MQLFVYLLCNPTRGAAPYCDIRFLLAKDSGAAAQVCQQYMVLGFLYTPPLELREFQTLVDTLKIPTTFAMNFHYHAFIPDDNFFLPLGRHDSREAAIAHGRDNAHRHIAIVLTDEEAHALTAVQQVLEQHVYELHSVMTRPAADALLEMPIIRQPFRMRV